MKRLLILILTLYSIQIQAQADGTNVGIFQTYVFYTVDGSPQTDAGSENPEGHPTTFDGTALGTISSLELTGAEVKSYKNAGNGGDVTGATFHYNIFPASGSLGAFTPLNLPFGANLDACCGGNPGDQSWIENTASIDLLSGLAPGDYVLQVYWEASTNEAGCCFDSNPPNDFQATFTIAAPPEVPTLSEWGLIILALSFMTLGTLHLTQQRREQA